MEAGRTVAKWIHGIALFAICPGRYLRIAAPGVAGHTVIQHGFEWSGVAMRRVAKQNIRAREGGQGMTEYIVIVALVAVAAIAVYQSFGQVVRSQTAAMARELAGEDGSEQSRAAQSAADAAATQTAARSLKSFTGNAGGGQ